MTVPAEVHAQLDPLYKEIDEYAKANPDKVINEEPYQPTIEELKKIKLSEINNKYNIATSTLVSTYPEIELLTFDKQEQEARAYLEDSSVETPFLTILAETRGIELSELVKRVINKSETFSNIIAFLTGQRQKYEDQLELANTKEEIENIKPEYTFNK